MSRQLDTVIDLDALTDNTLDAAVRVEALPPEGSVEDVVAEARRCFRGRKALIVEDDDDLRRALTLRLGSLGFEVHDARDGLGAVQQAREVQPDVILLDIGLPCGDGFRVIPRIRDLECAAETPIVVLTGRSDEDDERRCLDAGAQEFLTKLTSTEKLLRALLRVLPAA